MKVAVTGGGGYLGYHVTKAFDAWNLSRSTGFDVTKLEDCKRELHRYDAIIHMAALVDKSETCPERVMEVNAQGTLNVVQSLREGQTLVFASTKDVCDSGGAYDVSKMIAEKYVRYYAQYSKFKAGIFRMATMYAPAIAGSGFVNFFVDSIQNEKELTLFYQGKQMRDYLYITDLIEAFSLFIHSPKPFVIYDIGGGQENSATLLGLVRLIEQVLGMSAILKFSDEKVPGQMWHITNVVPISYDLKWKPKVSIVDGIKKLIQEVRK